MFIKDSYQNTLRLSEESNLFLLNNNIAPNPTNYAVIYLYISRKNPEIKSIIDQKLKKNEILTADFLNELFLKFVSNTKNIEKIILAPFEKVLNSTLEKIQKQVVSEENIQSSLNKADRVLNQNEDAKSWQNVVKFLFSTIENSKSQHQSLADELSKTSEEVNNLKFKLEQSRHEALLDALTGLLNRRGCDEKLKDISIDSTHSSLAIDIDHFKKVNDEFGHFVGDRVIQRVAKTIQNNLKNDDLAVRYGGEEFVVVLPHQSKIQANAIAEKIRIDISELKLIQRDTNTVLPSISVSIGIAEVENDKSWLSVFQRADTALYQAKNSGRNCCIYA